MFYYFCRFLCFIFCRVFLGLKVYGRQNIPREGSFILASNHISNLDPVVVGVACPRALDYMAKQELFNVFLFARFLKALRVFPIQRKAADFSGIKEAMRRLKNKKGLLMFPQGTRNTGTDIEPNPGVGFLALKANVPVIPALVKGTEIAMPKGAKFIRTSRVSVYFGKQILFERRMPYQDIARQLMADIRHLSC